MIQPGNTKLGLLVWSWSLLAGLTCPGKTKLCSRLCYACHGRFFFPDVKESYKRNKKQADSAGFVSWMVLEIRRLMVQVIRVHSSGDIYSVAYAKKWIEIVRRCRPTTFYLYTRSWRDPEILPYLRRLSREPNVFVWFSCDRETGRPPQVARVRTTWMAENDSDVPPYRVDLVFRNTDKTVMKLMNGNLVCPYDNGVTRITCSRCRLCFGKRKLPHGQKQKAANVQLRQSSHGQTAAQHQAAAAVQTEEARQKAKGVRHRRLAGVP